MPGADDIVARERVEFFDARRELRAVARGEIGPAHVARKERVPREEMIARANARPARRMSRRGEEGKGDPAKRERLAVAEGKIDRKGRNGDAEQRRRVVPAEGEGLFRLETADLRPRRADGGAPADVVEMSVREQGKADVQATRAGLVDDARLSGIDDDGGSVVGLYVYLFCGKSLGINLENGHVSLPYDARRGSLRANGSFR